MRTLTERTIHDLKTYFDSRDHHPSAAMWAALTEAVEVMEQMADGTASPDIHLSSLDPGVGKTQAVVHFINNLLQSPAHKDVGVIVCLSRIEEITNAIEGATEYANRGQNISSYYGDLSTKSSGLTEGDFAVLTASEPDNPLRDPRDLTDTPVKKARVLFTTQQMVERRCRGKLFADVSDFYYQGKPRQVRIWDESILPGRTLVLDDDDLACIRRVFRDARLLDIRADVADFSRTLDEATDGDILDVPDFGAKYKMSLNDVLRHVYLEENRKLVSDLWLIGGKAAHVVQDNLVGNLVLNYEETLPGDLRPLVLDASGRVRATYDQWIDGRKGIRKLPTTAPKRYNALTIHCWARSGGKTAFRREAPDLLTGIADTINTKPNEEWLVVHHKDESIGLDFTGEVWSRLSPRTGQVHFLNWAMHHGTNEFTHVPNVILAGTLFYPMAYYTSLSRLASGKRPGASSVQQAEIAAMMIGEHKHAILQALCRGSVRQCDGDRCKPCTAYIIASARSGIVDVLPDIFPGCRVEPWQPIERELKGNVKATIEALQALFKEPAVDYVPNKVAMERAGITDRSYFNRAVRKHPTFAPALADHWLGMNSRGFVRIAHTYGFKVAA